MKLHQRIRNQLFVCINLFIFLTTILAVSVTLTIGSRAARLDGGSAPYWQHVMTFTVLSNLFLGFVALIGACLAIYDPSWSSGAKQRQAYLTWYLAATSAGLVTFTTVVCFLAPMRAISGRNYFDMLLEPMFFLHFFNPILAAISFIFLTGSTKLTIRSRFLATLPVVLYAVPYVLNVVVFRIWPDFYGLTFGGKYLIMPLVFVAFMLLAFGIASSLVFLRRKSHS